MPEDYRKQRFSTDSASSFASHCQSPFLPIPNCAASCSLASIQPINGDRRGDDRCIVLFGGGCSRYVGGSEWQGLTRES
jgi:hypothetical protein